MDGKEQGNLKQLVDENIKLARENNKMLKKMRSSMRWASFFRLLYWIVIIGSAVGAYYYLQPFIDGIRDNAEGIFSVFENVQNATSFLRE